MASDDEIRKAFHAQFGAAVGDTTSDPALLGTIRRRYDRDRRFMIVGAPLGIAVLAAGSITAAVEVGNGGGGARQTVHAADSGPTLTLLGHQFTFPVGWKVGKPFGLSAVPISNTGGTVASPDSSVETVSVRSPEGKPVVTLSVLRRGTDTVTPTDSPTPSGPTSTPSPGLQPTGAVGSVHCVTAPPAGKATTNSNSTGSDTAMCATMTISKIRPPTVHHRFANGDLLTASGRGMTKAELREFVYFALGN